MSIIEQWIKEIPVITRTYMFAAVITTILCSLDLLSPYSLYYDFSLVFTKFQFWRIFTTFIFFGSRFSFEFIFHMFFLSRYSRGLEEGSFRNRSADFAYMLCFGATIMLIVSSVTQMFFLGAPLTFMMVYLWARRNPHVRMNFLGVLNFTAPYLPWVLLSFSILLGNDGFTDIMGIVAGHLYYFLEDVFPRMLRSRKRLLKTPRLFELLFASGDAYPAPPRARAEPLHQEPDVGAAQAQADANDAANGGNEPAAFDVHELVG